MPTLGEGAIGSLDYTSEERKSLAKEYWIDLLNYFRFFEIFLISLSLSSLTFTCSICKTTNAEILQSLTDKSDEISDEAKKLASQITFKDKVPNELSRIENNSKDESTVHKRSHKAVVSNEDMQEEGEAEVASTPDVSSNNRIYTDQRNSLSLLYVFLGALFLFLIIRRIYLMIE